MDFFNSSNFTIDTTFESTLDSVDGAQQKIEPAKSNDLIEKIMLLYLKHNLTLVCLEDLIKLLNETLEECKKLPTGKVQIMNLFRAHLDSVDIFYFVKCSKCRKYSKADSDNKNSAKCSRCDNCLKTTETNFFVSLPIEHQLKKSVKDNWSYIQKFTTDRDPKSTTITDAHDGAILRNIFEKYQDSDVNILSLMINVDGANKFKSNTKSVWPIQLVQNYLPPNIRFLPQNIIVTGLQYVNSKDDGSDDLNFREFMLPLINELNDIKKDNIKIEMENDIYTFKPVISHAAVDLPAKSKFGEMKQCGGYDSCTYCDIHGELVEVEKLVNKNVKTKKRAKNKSIEELNSGTALQKKPKTFVRYLEGNSCKIRGEVDTLQKMLLASSGKSPIDGIKDVSCLVALEHFNMTWSLSVEYMHLCLQGMTKRANNYFFNSKYSGKDFYIPPKRRVALNKTILAIKPPSYITRKPRSINQRLNFKATAVYTLLKTKISVEEISNSEKMLESFVKEHQDLFGKENMVMNVHMLKHRAESVRQLGPLWSHSAFPFERNNGCLLRWVNGTTDVVQQISSKYALSKAIHKPNLTEMKSKVLLGKSLILEETATHVLSIGSLQVLNFSNVELVVYKRIRLKNIVYTSLLYTRPKRSIDYFIGLDSGQFGTAKYYFEANGQIYVMFNQFEKIDNIYHILKVKSTNRSIVAPIEEISTKYVFMNIGLNSYIVSAPNPYEKE